MTRAREAQHTLHKCGLFLGKKEMPWVKSCIRHQCSRLDKCPAEVSIPAKRQSTRLFRNMHCVLQYAVNMQLWDSLAGL